MANVMRKDNQVAANIEILAPVPVETQKLYHRNHLFPSNQTKSKIDF